MFLNPFAGAFGLDIGDLSIKAVQLVNHSRLRRRRSYDVEVLRSTKLPKGLIVNGVIQEPEKVRKYISHLLYDAQDGSKPITSRWVVASLPDAQAFVKRIDIDKRSADIIREDITEAARHHIPFGEDEYYIDWQIMGGKERGEKTSVLISAISKSVADTYTYLLESLGLGVIALEQEAIAVTRAMITASKQYEGEARGILNLGAARSSFTVFDRDQLQFSVSLPFSGDAITETIARKCHLSYADAEKQKISTGLEYRKDREQCWASIKSVTDALAQEIQKAFRFYTTHFPDTNAVTHITMCGGGSSLRRLDRVISTKLKITAQPGNAWKNLGSTKPPPTDQEEGLRYTIAIGLALRAAANPFFTKDSI
jgi:type IV pilus assembly protein PilM